MHVRAKCVPEELATDETARERVDETVTVAVDVDWHERLRVVVAVDRAHGGEHFGEVVDRAGSIATEVRVRRERGIDEKCPEKRGKYRSEEEV